MMENGKSELDSKELRERIEVLEYYLGIKKGFPVFPLFLELDKIKDQGKMQEATVKFQKTHPDALIPEIAYEGDACFDLMAIEDTIIPPAMLTKGDVDIDTAKHILASGGKVILNNGKMTIVGDNNPGTSFLTMEEFLTTNPEIVSAERIEAETVKVGKAFVSVGLKMELPMGWEATFRTRSSSGVKSSMRVHPGTIDAGYRGELTVAVYNMGSTPVLVKKGQGIAQIAVRPVPKINIIEGEVNSDTQRGEKGFGSSDKV
jgi:dUTP pyrophosphatase